MKFNTLLMKFHHIYFVICCYLKIFLLEICLFSSLHLHNLSPTTAPSSFLSPFLLYMFLPFPSALSHSSSSSRIAWRGGSAARLTVLGASYTFTPVCAFFRNVRARFIRETAIHTSLLKSTLYTNSQQRNLIVGSAS